jgi:cytidine deaminase
MEYTATTKISQETLQVLIRNCKKSNIRYKHSAALIFNDEIINFGVNRFVNKKSIHAEIEALLNSSMKKFNGLDLIVIRTKGEELQNSRPCNHCIDYLVKKGIRKIYYSTVAGDITCEYVDNMSKEHICSSRRRDF